MYEGNETFSYNKNQLEMNMLSFWQWAYSDLSNNIRRSILAEYIVASALDITSDTRQVWNAPYDLLSKEGYKLEVKSAAYVQSWDAKHPDHVSYRIAPARQPDETGDYKIDSPLVRSADVYIFCLYKALTREESPLNLDLWDFFVLPTSVLDEHKPTQKTITLPVLMQLGPAVCKYDKLGDTIKNIMGA